MFRILDKITLCCAWPTCSAWFVSTSRWSAAASNGGRTPSHLVQLRAGRSLIDLVPASGAVEPRYGTEGPGPSIDLSDPEGDVVELKGPPNPV
jgi:hypothetical protein